MKDFTFVLPGASDASDSVSTFRSIIYHRMLCVVVLTKDSRLWWTMQKCGLGELPLAQGRGGGREELPQVRDQGRRPGRTTPNLRPGAAAKRSNPTSKERWLCGCRRVERSYSTLKVRRGGHEEIPLVQGKEQWLCFAEAAAKRYPIFEHLLGKN